MLASYADANQWLDGNKVAFVDDDDALPEATQASIMVRSALANFFPEHVSLWSVDPAPGQEATPEVVRTATALLMASYRYARDFSEETVKKPNYSSTLEDRAMSLLAGIADGSVGLSDVDYDTSTDSVQFNQDNFWPNANTGLLDVRNASGLIIGYGSDDDVKFTMSKEF